MSHDLRISARTETQNKFKIEGGSKLEVFDEDGKLLHKGEFKSFTSNFLKLLYGSMIGAGTAKAKDLTNTDLEMNSFPQSRFNITGGADVKKFGVVVGTNTAAVSVSDYNITVPSGLTLNATAVSASSVGADSISVEISRQIGNSTGSTVNLKEAGLVCGSEDEVDSNVLIARDLLNITLENGKKSVWRYTINFNFANDVGGFVKTFADKMFNGIFEEVTANANWVGRQQFGCVVFDNKIWVLGGYDGNNFLNDVWSSSDGVSWTEVSGIGTKWSGRLGFGCVVFDNKIWVLGGYYSGVIYSDVWCSSDGASWTLKTTSPGWQYGGRAYFGCVVFDNKIWVLGGSYDGTHLLNLCHSSPDGVNWSGTTAGWSGRRYFGCVVFDNKIWVLGGNDTGGDLNDVWSSSDGINWDRVTASAQWSGRNGFGCVVFNNKIWVLGGGSVWCSSDGAIWSKATNWTWQYRQGCVVFGNKIWVLGGYKSGIGINNNVVSTITLMTNLLPGSSDTPFSVTGTALGAEIADGSGSGQLVYGAMPGAGTTEPTVSGNKTKMSITREFTNNSGADITVREVGLFSGSDMLARLILATPVTITNNESKVITVDFETEV